MKAALAEKKKAYSISDNRVLTRLVPWLVVFLLIQTGVRFAILAASWKLLDDHRALSLIKVFLYGVFNDYLCFFFMGIPLSLALMLSGAYPEKRAGRAVVPVLFTASVFMWVFVGAAEWVFFKEFGRRFFFIIYQYLPYRDEVISSVSEAYPMPLILAALAVLTAGIVSMARPWRVSPAANEKLREKIIFGSLIFFYLMALTIVISPNRSYAAKEIERNGYIAGIHSSYQLYDLMKAEEPHYNDFYTREDDAGRILRREIDPKGKAQYLSGSSVDISRKINGNGHPVFPNVIVVMMESMDAANMASFGNRQNLTPNLDALAAQSVFFTNLYATGRGTIFGLQSFSVSMPTTGRVVPVFLAKDNGHLHTIGSLFQQRGYDTAFFYGGDSRFDEMKGFFTGNGYRVVDKNNFRPENLTFANGWGVDDESEFNEVIVAADHEAARHRRFFYHVMTMTNHQPYTYPDGRISVPSGSSREGAVRYADYAIGKFMEQARKKPWFGNTIFVFVSDHCVVGKGFDTKDFELEAHYHIPAFIYAPGLVQPRKIVQMTSQIDISPTLMGVLGWDYVSYFTGKDALHEKVERALIEKSSDEGLVYMTGDHKITVLQADKTVLQFQDKTPLPQLDAAHKARAIAYFQHSAEWRDFLKEKRGKNVRRD